MFKLFRSAIFAIAALTAFSSQNAMAAGIPSYQTATGNGYVWETSANVLVPANFSSICTDFPIDDDQAQITFPSGFKFPFAGTSYAAVWMQSDGRLQFGPPTGSVRNSTPTALPQGSSPTYTGTTPCGNGSSRPPGSILHVAWMALSLSAGGAMSWELKGTAPNRRMVFTWDNVRLASGAGSATFQAILYENGNAAYQYKSLTGASSWPSVATTGVQVISTDYIASTDAANGVRIDVGKYIQFQYRPDSTTGSTCAPMPYTVTAQDNNSATVSSYVGTISLYAFPASAGTFSLLSGNGVFTPANLSEGSPASYSFVASDLGVVKFNYSTSVAQRAMVSFTDVIFASKNVGNTVFFADNVFVVAPSDPSGLDVVAGRPHAMTATLYAKDAQGTCGVATSYSGTAQDMWYSPTSSNPAGAAAPSISTSASCASPKTLPSTAPGLSASSNNASIPFTLGVANFYLCTSDVGQYSISIRDDTKAYFSNPSITSVGGTSAALSARPFGLWIDSAVGAGPKANPGGTASSGSAFVAAGAPFSVRATARKWVAGQDLIKSGTPDPTANLSGNAILPAFTAPTTISLSAFTPSGGTAGALSGASLSATAYSAGAATASLTYSEVGSIQLSASAPSYLGSSFPVPGVPSSPIGRFIPASIALSSSSLASACPAGGYSYMGQSFGVAAKLVAYGSAGNQLANYDASLGYKSAVPPSWKVVDSANAVDLSSRTNLSLSMPAWTTGAWTYNNTTVFSRASSGPDGSYESLLFGLSGADSDGVPIASMDASFSAAGASCGSAACDMKTVGPATKARYGRLEARNVFGAILPTLKVPLQAMYWAKNSSGSLGWTPNTLDSCTTIPSSAVAVGGFTGSVSSATRPPSSVKLTLGKAEIPVTRSGGPASSGSALLGINLAPGTSLVGGGCYGSASTFPPFGVGASATYLRSDFCGAPNFFGNPSAKIIWGAPAAKSGSIVFSRESY